MRLSSEVARRTNNSRVLERHSSFRLKVSMNLSNNLRKPKRRPAKVKKPIYCAKETRSW